MRAGAPLGGGRTAALCARGVCAVRSRFRVWRGGVARCCLWRLGAARLPGTAGPGAGECVMVKYARVSNTRGQDEHALGRHIQCRRMVRTKRAHTAHTDETRAPPPPRATLHRERRYTRTYGRMVYRAKQYRTQELREAGPLGTSALGNGGAAAAARAEAAHSRAPSPPPCMWAREPPAPPPAAELSQVRLTPVASLPKQKEEGWGGAPMRSVRRRCRNAPSRGLWGHEGEQPQSAGRNHCSVGECCQRLQRRRDLFSTDPRSNASRKGPQFSCPAAISWA